MVQFVSLERRGFGGMLEQWLNVDMQGAWRRSPDVSWGWDKRKHDRICGLCASAVSAFTAWLRARGLAYEADIVQWRFDHHAPVPPFISHMTGTVQTLPGQMSLFG
jgi:hypothetical protein